MSAHHVCQDLGSMLATPHIAFRNTEAPLRPLPRPVFPAPAEYNRRR